MDYPSCISPCLRYVSTSPHNTSTPLTLSQIDLKFINRYHHSWPLAIAAIQHGILDLNPLVTHTFPLEEAKKALETAADRVAGSVKVHVVDGDIPR
jgi:L-iditol 2-dehydrogenase